MTKVSILLENIDPTDIEPRRLTNDCKFVQRTTGEIDLVRCHKMVDIFDYYYDRTIKLSRIWHAGGTGNPKFQKPDL
jgi:hypothetical protein